MGDLIPIPGQLASQADTDAQVLELWLHGRSPHTQRAYRADATRFVAFAGVSLRQVRLAELQAFAVSLSSLAPGSRCRTLAALKSLLAFGHKIGYLPFDVGTALKLPVAKDSLPQRILGEDAVLAMLRSCVDNERDAAIVRLAYVSGCRVAELCALKWRDVQPSKESGQISVFGKGAKVRSILLTTPTWRLLEHLRAGAGPDDPVFRSRNGGHLDQRQVRRIIVTAAVKAGLEQHVSPHWMRHAHASHALDHGAPVHLVQATLGHASVATTGRYLHARPSDSSSRFLPA